MQQRRSPGPSRATIVALALSLLLGLPIVVLAALGLLDYAADDYWQLCGLAGRSFPGGPDAGAMFRFFSGDAALGHAATVDGAYPWYADPGVKLSFWRPLSALTHRLDYALFGDRPTGAKIHGLRASALAGRLSLAASSSAGVARMKPRRTSRSRGTISFRTSTSARWRPASRTRSMPPPPCYSPTRA